MLKRILNSFTAPTPAPLPEPDEKLALGALMVRVAKSDHRYQPVEISRIDRLLARHFGLKPIEAAKMRATCEKLEHDLPDTARFAEVIRKTVRHQARIEALEAMWEVLLADGVIQDVEQAVIEEARVAMGLSEADNIAARAMAES
jgi:uncharacterized tellurite resistance protein B-like protein